MVSPLRASVSTVIKPRHSCFEELFPGCRATAPSEDWLEILLTKTDPQGYRPWLDPTRWGRKGKWRRFAFWRPGLRTRPPCRVMAAKGPTKR